MIYSILVIVFAFAWLLYETKWLTVRLLISEPYYPKIIAELVPLICASMIIFSVLRRFTSTTKRKQEKKQHWYYIFRKLLPTKISNPSASGKERE